MIPPIFQWASANAGVTALLGLNPTRFWPFASAPQKNQDGYGLPYAVWQLAFGAPENYLNQLPDADNAVIVVTAWGRTASEARDVMLALRDALATLERGIVTSYSDEARDSATGLFGTSFTAEFWTDR